MALDWTSLRRPLSALRVEGQQIGARQSAAVDKAMRLIARGLTPYAAAKRVGIALSTIYRALRRLEQQAKP